MASQGPLSPTTIISEAFSGSVNAWTTPSNAGALDSAYSQAAGIGATEYLKATAFGFTLPSDAVVLGILAEINRFRAVDPVTDARVRLVRAGTVEATDKSTGAAWSVSSAYVSFGSASDLWGASWSASEINAAGFGCAFAATLSTVDAVAAVDHIRITVTYASGSEMVGIRAMVMP